MSAPRRPGRSGGCWTCKLRRKKCDELRPICEACDNLEITCNYGPKPAWMNGGDQQRKMTEALKNEIKQNAANRRENANTSFNFEHNAAVHQFNVNPNMVISSEPEDTVMTVDQTLTSENNSVASHGSASSTFLDFGLEKHSCSNDMEQFIEADFIMKYLDFVFPALFPFYRPALFETGRAWLLLLLRNSKIAYHASLSLSSYFFTVAFTDAHTGEEYENCKQLRWMQLEDHTNKCFDSIRKDMLALGRNSEGTPATKLEKMYVMESIVQVLIFEIVLSSKSASWISHLAPASAFFEEIVACSSQSYQDTGHSKFTSVLLEIGQPSWSQPGYSIYIWSPDQAGFRFNAGLLIFIDVIASTATQKPPSLLKYHPDVLAPSDDGTTSLREAEVRLSSVVGCRNWVISSIAETSALSSWKEEQVKANSLSIVELVDRVSGIANDLKKGIFEIQLRPSANSPSYLSQGMPPAGYSGPGASFTSTLIWAYAAQLYLTVVVSGWQLSNTEVRANVDKILHLLRDVLPNQLRALAWPLCVAGCLALETEESSFLALFSDQGKIHTTGALDDARQIMEQVWQTRTTLHASTWNLASCFNILGSPVLLV